MKRAFLKELGIPMETMDKIMSEHGKDIERSKKRLKVLQERISQLEGVLDNVFFLRLDCNAGFKCQCGASLYRQTGELENNHPARIYKIRKHKRKRLQKKNHCHKSCVTASKRNREGGLYSFKTAVNSAGGYEL